MKTKLLLVFLFIGFSMTAQKKSQTKEKELNTNVITINLSTPSPKSVKSTEKGKRLTVRSRDFLQLELVGGNPFKYNYVIDKKLLNFFEDKSNNPLDNIQKIINQTPVKDTKSSEENDKIETDNKKLKEEVSKLMAKKEDKSNKGKPKNIAFIDTKISAINSVIISNEYKTLGIKSLKIINSEERGTNNDLEKPTNKEEDKDNVIKALRLIQSDLESFTTDLTNFVIVNKANDELIIKEFVEERDSKYKKFSKIVNNYSDVKQDAAKFKDLGTDYEVLNTTVASTLTSILANFREMYALKTQNYMLPIEFNGKNIDVVALNLKKFEKNNPVPIEECNYNVWLKGGFKIDVSGGVFISSLINKEFFADNDPNNAGKKIIKEKQKGNFDFGFGSTINISHRSAGWVNPTLNVGAMFSNTQQFQLLTGIGAILGKEERLIFSSGLSMGRITKLQGDLNVGDTNQDFGTSGTIPTTNVFSFGYYFGITYNFTSKTKPPTK